MYSLVSHLLPQTVSSRGGRHVDTTYSGQAPPGCTKQGHFEYNYWCVQDSLNTSHTVEKCITLSLSLSLSLLHLFKHNYWTINKIVYAYSFVYRHLFSINASPYCETSRETCYASFSMLPNHTHPVCITHSPSTPFHALLDPGCANPSICAFTAYLRDLGVAKGTINR